MKQILFTFPQVPILQNRVYHSKHAAESAPTGDLEICEENNFGCNIKFDAKLMKYDDQYDNSVPSTRFNAYYDHIADHLASRYDISSAPVIDIGCGKGTFLTRMAERHDFEGIGIDPSYQGPNKIGRLKFIAEEFHQRHVQIVPSLIICRHTLEHIPNPTSFLTSILSVFPKNVTIPVFCEVPDLGWIIKHKSWWDFCYEHVNYFRADSLKRCLQDAGCIDVIVKPEFDQQYLWAEGVLGSCTKENYAEYSSSPNVPPMDLLITKMLQSIKEQSTSKKIVIWGMATKGVMYAIHALRQGIQVDYGVDINTEKQGQYAPTSGLRISAPEDLPANEDYAVICMNPNYLDEVRQQLTSLSLNFIVLDP
jgi:SAM-dependent methyltransferase